MAVRKKGAELDRAWGRGEMKGRKDHRTKKKKKARLKKKKEPKPKPSQDSAGKKGKATVPFVYKKPSKGGRIVLHGVKLVGKTSARSLERVGR